MHQGNWLNPYINYPFLTWDRATSAAAPPRPLGMHVKHYYTVREPELDHRIFALRSLGGERTDGRRGRRASVGEEHLGRNYWQAWYQAGPQECEHPHPALEPIPQLLHRGLKFLCEHAACSGIYLDDIAYDRSIMLRARKVLDRYTGGGLIDLHRC